ncbi:hypothetical protein WA577_000956, partial [Blastocystis sp. JDR]
SLHLYAQYLYAVHHALTPLSLDLFASSPLSLSLSASACSVTSSQRVTCLFVSTPITPSQSILHYQLRFHNADHASLSLGLSTRRRAVPFFGCDADSFGLNCTTNQFFHNSLALSVPFSTGKPCFLPSQASFLLHFFVDAISGCFWVANEQEDVVTYPCDGLPNKPLFFGLVAIQQNAQPLRIELSQAFEPVLSRHTAYDYLTLLHQRLHRSLQRECAFFSAQLPMSPSQTESQSQSQSESQSQSQTESQSQSESALESQSQPAPQSENALRFHAKKT